MSLRRILVVLFLQGAPAFAHEPAPREQNGLVFTPPMEWNS